MKNKKQKKVNLNGIETHLDTSLKTVNEQKKAQRFQKNYENKEDLEQQGFLGNKLNLVQQLGRISFNSNQNNQNNLTKNKDKSYYFKWKNLKFLEEAKQLNHKQLSQSIKIYQTQQLKKKNIFFSLNPILKKKFRKCMLVLQVVVFLKLTIVYQQIKDEENYYKFKNYSIISQQTLNNQESLKYAIKIEKIKQYEIILERLKIFKYYFNYFLVLFVLYLRFKLPLLLAFINQQLDDAQIDDKIFCTVFFINIVIIQLSSFLKKQTNQYRFEKNKEKKIQDYIEILLDFISILPLFELSIYFETYQKEFQIQNFVFFLQWTKVIKANTLKRKDVIQDYLNHDNRFSKKIRYVQTFYEIFQSAHYATCLWIFLSQITEQQNSTFFTNNDIDINNKMDIYIVSLYWVMQTLSTVGYGDLQKYEFATQRLPDILYLLVGAFIYTYWISMISSLLIKNVEKQEILDSKINIIEQFTKITKIDYKLTKKIIDKFKYNNEKSYVYNYDPLEQMFKMFPQYVRKDIILQLHPEISNFVFFNQRSQIFQLEFILRLKQQIYKPQQFIYKKKQNPNSIYFVSYGKVNLITTKQAVFKSYLENSYFGEIEILFQKFTKQILQRLYTARAEQDTLLLYISRLNFIELMEQFPQYQKEILAIAQKRFYKNQKSKALVKKIQCINQNSQFWEHSNVENVFNFVKQQYRQDKNCKDKKNPIEFLDQIQNMTNIESFVKDKLRIEFNHIQNQLHSIENSNIPLNNIYKINETVENQINNMNQKIKEILESIEAIEQQIK